MILYPGTMLQDRYEILEKIGSGGMSDVYKAKCHKLNRLVAIKVLKSEFTSDATFVSKFKMEAQAAAGLSHPNIVNIYDVVDEGDIHFIVMELVEGITLKSYITKKGHLEVKEAIGIAIQVASGIEAAHEQHIIHRDIKPQNMLISMDGKVKVADFGIARAVSSQTMNAATVVGSVHYISPEQARGGYSDERSDLYSLGITMFEMVTGHVPFEGDNTVTVALAHLEDPMPDPRTLNPEVSPSLARIILKCTEKRPERRYPSAAAVISDLRRALLNDDDPNVGVIEEEDHSSDTIVISPNELNMIKTRSGERIRESKPVKEIRERRERRDLEKRYEQPEDAKKDQKKSKENDEATGLEKILTGLGVAAAVIIVAVVIVFILKLGGLFRSSTPEDPTEQVSQEATAEEAKTTVVSETTISQKEVYMPNLVGHSQDEAEKILQGLDLSMQVEQENSDDVEKGMVISQKEKPDTVIPRFSKVTVVISAGSDKVDLAELGLSGMTLETAVRLLEGKNLKADVQEESSEDVPSGTIIRYEPEDKVALGSTVTLYVSTGPEEEFVSVPNLYGKTDAEASVLLSAAGLVAGEISKEYDSTISAGHVISQGVEAGTQVAPGETVDYTVSLGPEAPKKQFIASLDASYPLQVSYGPGAASSEIQILIRLKQAVNGKVTYTKLAEPKSYSADTTLNIKLDKIRGADGVQTGEVEIVDLTNNVVLTSYNVTFTEVDS